MHHRINEKQEQHKKMQLKIKIWELLATKAPPSSLSWMITASKPAFCALLTLSSKLHPPLIINAIGEVQLLPPCSTEFVNGEHASRGSAMYNLPQTPVDKIGADKTNHISTQLW